MIITLAIVGILLAVLVTLFATGTLSFGSKGNQPIAATNGAVSAADQEAAAKAAVQKQLDAEANRNMTERQRIERERELLEIERRKQRDQAAAAAQAATSTVATYDFLNGQWCETNQRWHFNSRSRTATYNNGAIQGAFKLEDGRIEITNHDRPLIQRVNENTLTLQYPNGPPATWTRC